jgi:hypothetical protein
MHKQEGQRHYSTVFSPLWRLVFVLCSSVVALRIALFPGGLFVA